MLVLVGLSEQTSSKSSHVSVEILSSSSCKELRKYGATPTGGALIGLTDASVATSGGTISSLSIRPRTTPPRVMDKQTPKNTIRAKEQGQQRESTSELTPQVDTEEDWTLCIRLLLFPWFSSFEVLTSDKRLKPMLRIVGW